MTTEPNLLQQLTDALNASLPPHERIVMVPLGPRPSGRRALATQAVLDYFKAHPEAGEPPLFHHRQGIAVAVMEALSRDVQSPATDPGQS